MVLSHTDIEIGDRVRFATLPDDNFNGPNARRLLGICGTVTHIGYMGTHVRVYWDEDIEAGGSFGRFNVQIFRPSSLELVGPRRPIEPIDDSEVREVWY